MDLTTHRKVWYPKTMTNHNIQVQFLVKGETRKEALDFIHYALVSMCNEGAIDEGDDYPIIANAFVDDADNTLLVGEDEMSRFLSTLHDEE